MGVGTGQTPELVELVRLDIQADHGSQGILAQIERTVPPLLRRHSIARIGVGFGGPINAATGIISQKPPSARVG